MIFLELEPQEKLYDKEGRAKYFTYGSISIDPVERTSGILEGVLLASHRVYNKLNKVNALYTETGEYNESFDQALIKLTIKEAVKIMKLHIDDLFANKSKRMNDKDFDKLIETLVD